MTSSKQRFRTLWLSDIHLGFKDCKAEYLLAFLRDVHCERIILAGDIIDIWSLRQKWHWPQSHSDVVTQLLLMRDQGCELIYVPGNHDAAIRQCGALDLNLLTVTQRYWHTTAQGKRVLVIHGDEFDGLVCPSRLMAWVGDRSYDLLLWLNRCQYHIRRRLGLEYWSLAGYIKNRVKNAHHAIARFRHAAIDFAKQHHADVVVCGHIHHPEIVDVDSVRYCNLGDWVENCTALVEHLDGSLHLVHVSEQQIMIANGSFVQLGSRGESIAA